MEKALDTASVPTAIDMNLCDPQESSEANTKLRDLVNQSLYQSVQANNVKIIEKFVKRYEKTGFLFQLGHEYTHVNHRRNNWNEYM